MHFACNKGREVEAVEWGAPAADAAGAGRGALPVQRRFCTVVVWGEWRLGACTGTIITTYVGQVPVCSRHLDFCIHIQFTFSWLDDYSLPNNHCPLWPPTDTTILSPPKLLSTKDQAAVVHL